MHFIYSHKYNTNVAEHTSGIWTEYHSEHNVYVYVYVIALACR